MDSMDKILLETFRDSPREKTPNAAEKAVGKLRYAFGYVLCKVAFCRTPEELAKSFDDISFLL